MDAAAGDSSASAPAGASAGSHSSGALGRAIGLDDAEVAQLGLLFGELAGSLGLDGTAVFGRLAAGQGIGQALAMPAHVCELIYARAHRWFAVGRIDRAEQLFRALCLLDDETADYQAGLGVCLRAGGHLAQAEGAFLSAARLRPAWAVPYLHLAELAIHQHQRERAASFLAACDSRAGDDVSPAIPEEAARLRAALDMAAHAGGSIWPRR